MWIARPSAFSQDKCECPVWLTGAMSGTGNDATVYRGMYTAHLYLLRLFILLVLAPQSGCISNFCRNMSTGDAARRNS